ncbi:MAG TPA: flagellar motor protein MotB [Bryobacteraceae bacterium]|nr:flagellar motor protein MotB [Bryobacteraceae bacterium]
MARKKHAAEHENHERWLVSYADFITLLFAFFVVMFASSQTDKSKAQQVSAAVKEALEKGGVTAAVHEILGGTVDERGKGNAMLRGPGGTQPKLEVEHDVVAELVPSLHYLSQELAKEITDGKIEIKMEPRGLVVSLRQATFFPSGEDSLDPATYQTIDKIAATIRNLPNPVRLEGHTDSVPIHTARFRSNWELSAARSISVMELLATRYDIPRERMGIAGYADTQPVDSNGTEDGRAHNRRVDVVILNQQVLSKDSAPGAAAPAPPSTAASASTPAQAAPAPSTPAQAAPAHK